VLRKTIKQYKHTKQLFLAGLGLAFVTFLAVSNPSFTDWEIVLLHWVYGWPVLLQVPMTVITSLGTTWFVLFLLAVLFVIHKYRLGLRIGFASGAAYLLAVVLKLLVHRPRPPELLTDVHSREVLTFGYGFPSGHTALVVAVGLTILPVVPRKYRWIVYLLMILVGISRMYLGVHAPLDVIGGALIGVLAAFATASIRRILPGLKLR
jgi:undecaprenyl-diphosphatase